VLALAAFVVASDATLVVALLRPIAATLSVSPAAAGQAVTAYAAGYALGAPLIIGAAQRSPRRRVLLGALGLFAASNAATAAAPSLAALLAARVAAGACGGGFMAAAAATAAGSVISGQRGRALAVIVGGSSAGTAFGVPLGAFAGGAVGWRPVFFGVTAVAALAAVAAAAWFRPESGSPGRRAASVFPSRAALGILATTLVWATGSFTFFTYIGMILHQTASAGPAGLAGFLLAFGLAGLAGAAAAGWLTDKKGPLPTLAAGLALTTVSLTGLGVIAAVGSAAVIASGAAVIGYGLGTWAITPPQQHWLLSGNGDGQFLLSLNSSALYGGVALGSLVGGLTLTLTRSASAVCWTAAGIELAALTLAGKIAHGQRLRGRGS
jgi:MFS transporter, DHA1 family, inner membrane transport protein